ncbi:MAG: hypothetical protein JNM28_07000 [Armatimonadetes bacterium]|nr:hypothetical protein [Armatimonadota bacterium]
MVLAFIPLLAPAPTYISRASYPAKSPIRDQVSPGGFAESVNLPQPNTAKTPNTTATVAQVDGVTTVTLANRDNPNLWIRAADGNLLMWLEAKNGKKWQPIQYHLWITCGNSYHRVNLPEGQNFEFHPKIVSGTLQTQIRLAFYAGTDAVGSEPSYSAPTNARIDPSQFLLDPQSAVDHVVATDWVIPTLMPKRNH